MNQARNNKIDEILESLDNCQSAKAPDFFYTRLQAKMHNLDDGAKIQRPLILRPAFAMSALAALVIINLFIIFQNKATPEENTALTDSETFQSIAAEYSLNDNAVLFDITQEK